MLELVSIAWLAFLLDLIFGDPCYAWHPVRLIGHLITFIEKRIYQDGFMAGLILVLSTVGVSGLILITIYAVLAELPFVLTIISLFLLYSCIGFRDLLNHAQPIYRAVKNQQLNQAQNALQMIVGRDAKQLDFVGVIRATIESLAENTVDGLFSVVFYFLITGLMAYLLQFSEATVLLLATLAAVIYRIVNTLDAMVGYKNTRYRYFGTASARFDDLLNFIPARLSVLFFLLASMGLGLLTSNAYKIVKRDRLKHNSPNAGHAEAVVAGALGIKLGGPTIYPHGTVNKLYLGDGRERLIAKDIKTTEKLVLLTGVLYVLILGLLLMGF